MSIFPDLGGFFEQFGEYSQQYGQQQTGGGTIPPSGSNGSYGSGIAGLFSTKNLIILAAAIGGYFLFIKKRK